MPAVECREPIILVFGKLNQNYKSLGQFLNALPTDEDYHGNLRRLLSRLREMEGHVVALIRDLEELEGRSGGGGSCERT